MQRAAQVRVLCVCAVKATSLQNDELAACLEAGEHCSSESQGRGDEEEA